MAASGRPERGERSVSRERARCTREIGRLVDPSRPLCRRRVRLKVLVASEDVGCLPGAPEAERFVSRLELGLSSLEARSKPTVFCEVCHGTDGGADIRSRGA